MPAGRQRDVSSVAQPQAGARYRMQRQPTRDTVPELKLRRILHRNGLRYYVHRRPLAELNRKADVVFPRARVAVFVDGCFWHGCLDHRTVPKTNTDFWRSKILANADRDDQTDRSLREAGWTVVRIWEHDDVERASAVVIERVRATSEV